MATCAIDSRDSPTAGSSVDPTSRAIAYRDADVRVSQLPAVEKGKSSAWSTNRTCCWRVESSGGFRNRTPVHDDNLETVPRARLEDCNRFRSRPRAIGPTKPVSRTDYASRRAESSAAATGRLNTPRFEGQPRWIFASTTSIGRRHDATPWCQCSSRHAAQTTPRHGFARE